MSLVSAIFLLLIGINGCLGFQKQVIASIVNLNKVDSIPQSILDLNSCFRYVPDIRLKISAEHVGGTESIQFKDECLRACMRSMIQEVFICRSLMHIPSDDDCLLTSTDMNHTEYERTTDFPPTNYYENLCLQSPYGSDEVRTEAKFNSFKGGEGIIKFSQKYAQPTKAMLILDGMKENTKIQIRHYPENTGDCYKLSKEEVARAQPILETLTDSTGMAVSPWSDVGMTANNANILENLILVVQDDHTVIECGKVKLALNSHEHAALKSNGPHLQSNVFVQLVIVISLWLIPLF